MREHEMDDSHPAPRNTPALVLWLMFLVAVACIGAIAMPRPALLLASATRAASGARGTASPTSERAVAVAQTRGREPTAMGD